MRLNLSFLLCFAGRVCHSDFVKWLPDLEAPPEEGPTSPYRFSHEGPIEASNS